MVDGDFKHGELLEMRPPVVPAWAEVRLASGGYVYVRADQVIAAVDLKSTSDNEVLLVLAGSETQLRVAGPAYDVMKSIAELTGVVYP